MVFKNTVFLTQVLIVGNGAVGKSSMIQRYCRGTFTKEISQSSIIFMENIISKLTKTSF